MHLKLNGYCLGVLVINTIITITLPSAGRCEPTVYSSQLAPHNDRSGVLTTGGPARPAHRGGGQRLHFGSRSGQESRRFPYFNNFDNRDGTRTGTSGGPEQTLKPKMAPPLTDRSVKSRNKQKRGEWERLYPSLKPPNEDCSKGSVEHVVPGKFYITGQLETNPNVGYQSDSAVSVQAQGGQERIRGQRPSASEESWQRLQPVVECGDDTMTLTVRRRRAVQLQLDRVNDSSVPLSQLSPHCGYLVQTTWRDLSLMAQYDACHVTQEDDSYVLPLVWRGTPVKMSCPDSQIQLDAVGPPSLCCSPYGMTVRVQGLYDTEDLRVNVRGEWTPLVVLAEQCGYTLERQDAEIVITAPFISCGITVKEGEYTISLQMGEKMFTLACPVSPPEELQLTHNSPHHLTRGPMERMLESLEPFPWAPPFYLAPPYYPHPTYRHKKLRPDGHDAYNPFTPSSLTPDSTSGPPPFDHYHHQIPETVSYKHVGVHSSLSSTDDAEDSSRVYPDLQQRQETPVLGVSGKHSAAHAPSSHSASETEPPPLQPPNHAFNPYYHYYHHPKIPLPGPPQDPDPDHEAPGELSLINPHNHDYPVLPPSVQQSEALRRVDSHQFLQPVPEAASHPSILPTSPPKISAPYTQPPPQPYPHHYFYNLPHIATVQARRLAPLNPDTAAKTNLSDDQDLKSNTFVYPLPHSSQVHDTYNLNPHADQPNSDKMIDFQNNSPEGIKHPLLPEEEEDDDNDEKAELDDRTRHSVLVTPAVQSPLLRSHPSGLDTIAVPPPEQRPFPTPSPNQNLLPHPYYYYYHPYYHYYHMHYGHNHFSPTSSKEALDPLLQASSSPPQLLSYPKHQTATPPTKSVFDFHNALIHPYYFYYYHLYYRPEVSVHNQELHPAGSLHSESASKSESQLLSDSHYSGTDWRVHAGYPSNPQPQHSPSHSLSSHYMTEQHPYDPLGHPSGDETEERLSSEMRDQLKGSPSTPSASPCGLGPVSDFDCSVSLGCCSYAVKDCTTGQHLMFAVPDSVVEPSMPPPAHPSDLSIVSCTLQQLTSDPDIYTVPLDFCGENKCAFGQTVVHPLEAHGIHSHQDHSSVHESAPVRLLVECTSSPGFPGEVRLHVVDQPPPPPPIQSTPDTVSVQLRIATDESFTSFHPEAHLPLSLVRGRPVYVEVNLLDPPEPDLVLLIHSCLAYTHAPYTSWMLVYDGCPNRGDTQLLPSLRSEPHHIRRIEISGFLSLPSESPSFMAEGGYSNLEDPEIFFLCLTEVCSAADGDCTVGCIHSPTGDV